MTSNEPSTIDLDALSLDQLNQLKQQEEGRLQTLTSHYAQLRQAAAKLNSGQRAVQQLGPVSEGKEILVPLTESVYVPAKVKDHNKLLVDLGTGYYCEKSCKETVAYLDRKLKLVDANSENITTVIQGTRQNLDSIQTSMQGKLLEIRAKQEGRIHQQSETKSS